MDFIQRAKNLVFIGPPGTGKSGLAIALLRKALINGDRARFDKAQDLFDELYASLADRSTSRLLNRLSRYDALLIDSAATMPAAYCAEGDRRLCERDRRLRKPGNNRETTGFDVATAPETRRKIS